MKPKCGVRDGFTLLEVLAVVGIIGLLVSLLLPSLNLARQHARSSACKSNLHQLGIGMTMYLHQYDVYPGHQWILPGDRRIRWFNAMAKLLKSYEFQGCAAVSDWEIGRNNSYGYNYKYLGSARDNLDSPKAPLESFPVKQLRFPARTIAFGDSDGTGWIKEHVRNVNDVDMLGNHGYTLDPTFIPEYSLTSYSAGVSEPYAWKRYRTYISTRHNGKSNLCFADGHVEPMSPRQVYEDNRYWNGLGGEDITRDKHVTYKLLDGQWRFPEIP
jgi:prepilin-type processing-associated H-X9-DG protein/prepilin-type N-terminal cleavage/methylation domain-containing protein